ncbi:MAG: cellulase family glycosylhydrolase [Armatimonadota bacterium]|nr:cellulase family glycosylhydrolase [Armatimonadota bacterium]
MKTNIWYLSFFLALLLISAARPDALPPPIIPQCVGVNIHFTGAPARDLDGLQSGGFGWVRMDFVWDAIEKVKGQYDFSAYDTLVAGLAERHIKPLFILDYGNDLYQKQAPRSPEARAAFARFAAAAVTHYKGKPILWEIWNEPNGGFWPPRANVLEYRQLAFETARAIKQADPNATVLAPGTSGIPLDFLESVFQTGILRYLDAVSLHPYRGDNPESAAREYASVRRLIQKYAPKGKRIPLVSSEWGYTTVSVSEKQQADYLARQWLFNLSEGVRLSIWYDWHDDGTDPKNGEHNFGTVHNDYTPKPAFLAAQRLTHTLGGYRFVKRLPLVSDRDYLLLFAKGPAVKLAYWTTGDAHAVSLPGGRHLTLTPSPQYFDAGSDAALRATATWTATTQDSFYSSGQTLKLALAYQNRDRRRHSVHFEMMLRTPDGMRIPVGSRVATIASGQARDWQASLPSLARIPGRVQVSLIFDGVRQPYSQDVVFTPTDPLELSAVPLTGNRFQVGIANPAGTPFIGHLSLSSSGHITSVPVRLATGQTTLTVTVPGTPGQGINCLLRDAHGHFVAQLPPLRFIPYPAALSSLRAVLDGDLKVPSTVHLTPATPSPGGTALRLDYQFAPGWSFARVAEPQSSALTGKPVGLGLWVYGDGSGNTARMRFRDASGQILQPNGLNVDWQGWRFVTFRLIPPPGASADIGHWGGENDGVVHYPVQADTLFLLDSNAEARRHQGTLQLKQPTVIYEAEK